MRRVVSVWLPTLPTDRLRRHSAVPLEGPLITTAHVGRRMTVVAVDTTAAELGLCAGMPLAEAQALVKGLVIRPAEPEADGAALQRLAGWCLRYAPLASADAPDGIRLDVTGCAHLYGGEMRLLHDLVDRMNAQGITARAAVADTPGAAHAVARFGNEAVSLVPCGETKAALASLPIEALRLPPNIIDDLRLLGFGCVAQLGAMPRAPLTRRFGPLIATRLDQALGAAFEPIVPVFPPELVQARLSFVEPLLTAEAFATMITKLTHMVCAEQEQREQGARRLDLLFERVDGAVQYLRIGTARPSRDARHLAQLLQGKLERVDPGPGVEAMRLVVPIAEPLTYVQTAASLAGGDQKETDVSALVDRLENRLGAARVWRAAPVESDIPERSVRRIPALAPPTRTSWPTDPPRPVRLLNPPQPVEAIALLPDQPPITFTWRRVRHRVRRADGPERMAGEWWTHADESGSIRDYFQVEDEEGRRFWLFRRGNGEDPATGDLQWFLHGFF